MNYLFSTLSILKNNEIYNHSRVKKEIKRKLDKLFDYPINYLRL